MLDQLLNTVPGFVRAADSFLADTWFPPPSLQLVKWNHDVSCDICPAGYETETNAYV